MAIPFWKNLLFPPIREDALLPRSRNLAMRSLLALSQAQARPDPRPNELSDSMSDLYTTVPTVTR